MNSMKCNFKNRQTILVRKDDWNILGQTSPDEVMDMVRMEGRKNKSI